MDSQIAIWTLWSFILNVGYGCARFLLAFGIFLVFVDGWYLNGITTREKIEQGDLGYCIFLGLSLFACVYAMGLM